MKLERNDETYQVVDKTIEELNKDLEEVDLKIGILRLSQKIRNFSCAMVTSTATVCAILYVLTNDQSKGLFTLLFVAFAFSDLRKSKKNEEKVDLLEQRKVLLEEAKEQKVKKLTR